MIYYHVILQKIHESKALDKVAPQEQTKQEIEICINKLRKYWNRECQSLIGDLTAVNGIGHTNDEKNENSYYCIKDQQQNFVISPCLIVL